MTRHEGMSGWIGAQGAGRWGHVVWPLRSPTKHLSLRTASSFVVTLLSTTPDYRTTVDRRHLKAKSHYAIQLANQLDTEIFTREPIPIPDMSR